MKRRLSFLVAIAMSAGLITGAFSYGNASAASVQETKDKFYRRAFMLCYKNFKKSVSAKEASNLSSVADLLSSDTTKYGVPPGGSSDEMTCSQIFKSIGNMLAMNTSKSELMESLGYVAMGGSDARSATFYFPEHTNGQYNRDGGFSLTISYGGSNSRAGGADTGVIPVGTNFAMDSSGATYGWYFRQGGTSPNNTICLTNITASKGQACANFTFGKTTWNKLISDLNTALTDKVRPVNANGTVLNCGTNSNTNPTGNAGASANTGKICMDDSQNGYGGMEQDNSKALSNYKMPSDWLDGFKVAYKTIFGEDYNADTSIGISLDEGVALYQNYLNDYYGIEYNEDSCKDTKAEAKAFKSNLDATWTTLTRKYSSSGGGGKWCYAHATKNNDPDNGVYGLEGNVNNLLPAVTVGTVKNNKKVDFKGIAKWLRQNGPDSIDSAVASTIDDIDIDEANADAEDDVCFDGAGALGWVLCPVVDGLAGLLNTVYSWVEENFLQLPAAELFDREDGVYQAWSVLQSISNIVFVIIFLVVIFSQVTGYGIDNYGIKRMLPRLIIAAILVNFSYLICQFLVDISNIVGSSINSLFHSFAGVTVSDLSVSYDPSPLHAAGSFIIIGIPLAAAIFDTPAIILTLFTAVVSAMIAVFFMWAVLVAREVGVIVAVVLSPLALVSYILPSLAPVFKYWRKLLQGLLLLYPLCGLLMGASFFVSVLLGNLSTGNDAAASGVKLAAMLVRVLPFFALPMLFRGSINAIGGLGNTLGNLSRNLRRDSTRSIRQSDSYQRASNWLNNRSWRGVRDKFAQTKVGQITGFAGRRNRQVLSYQKQQQEDQNAQNLIQRNVTERIEKSHPELVAEKRMADEIKEAIKGNNPQKYYALLNDYIRRNGGKKGAEIARQAIEEAGEAGLMSASKRAETLTQMQEQFGSQFGGNDFALNKYLSARGADKDGKAMKLSSFENLESAGGMLNIGDISDEQAAQLNPKNIERMIKNGIITQAQAQRLKSNKKLRQQMDDVQQLMYINYAETGEKDYTKDDAEKELQTPAGTNRVKPLPDEVTIAGGGGGGGNP